MKDNGEKPRNSPPNKPKKSLGQHFLTSVGAIKRIVDAADIQEGETVLEIGPGRGVLTKALLEAGARVVAVEKDEALAAELHTTFADAVVRGQLTLVVDDIENVQVERLPLLASGAANEVSAYKLVANIPYYITGLIIRRFLTARIQPSALVLLVQKEVAERIGARDGKESLLSISVKLYGEPRTAGTVKAGSFNPPPKVDSAILVVDQISCERVRGVDEAELFNLLHLGFGQKRKQLAGNLARRYPAAQVRSALERCRCDARVRAEDLSAGMWLCLAQSLSKSD
ncbi:MAG: 16S rRNA (adenine(1518)-N(6)/adenine(1519)-N(6))-dimethyltransferase RsmA [Candidatus Paceibacterota bacterium]